MDFFGRLAKSIKLWAVNLATRLIAYIKRLLFPLYLFPLKLVTYTAYYLIKFFIKFIIALISLFIDALAYPFKSFKNFLKASFIVVIFVYLVASLFVILDYITKEYGFIGKFICSYNVSRKLKNSVVRIVGGFSEGTGFFIASDQVITSFHVIAGEPSPKIIFPDGNFVTPVKIVGNKDADLAVLYTEGAYNDFVLPLPESLKFYGNEPLVAAGYALGTDLTGHATTLKGRFIEYRKSKYMPVGYIQTDISLVKGMSGGPLVDQCGTVVGINTMSLAGLSLFVSAIGASSLLPVLSDQDIKKIEVDPSASPEEAVRAFYTYLKARRMQDGFNLLSKEYLQKTDFEEWNNRFKDILDVDIIKSERYQNSKDTAFVKFSTKNWNAGEADYHYYEGTWQTVFEDGVYKMLKSRIKEVENVDWLWYFD